MEVSDAGDESPPSKPAMPPSNDKSTADNEVDVDKTTPTPLHSDDHALDADLQSNVLKKRSQNADNVIPSPVVSIREEDEVEKLKDAVEEVDIPSLDAPHNDADKLRDAVVEVDIPSLDAHHNDADKLKDAVEVVDISSLDDVVNDTAKLKDAVEEVDIPSLDDVVNDVDKLEDAVKEADNVTPSLDGAVNVAGKLEDAVKEADNVNPSLDDAVNDADTLETVDNLTEPVQEVDKVIPSVEVVDVVLPSTDDVDVLKPCVEDIDDVVPPPDLPCDTKLEVLVEEVVPSLDVPLDVLDGVEPPVKNDDDKVMPSCGEVAEEVKRCVEDVVEDVCSLLDVPVGDHIGVKSSVEEVDQVILSSEEVKPYVKEVVEEVVPSLDVPLDVLDGMEPLDENVDTLIPSSEEVAEEVKPCVKEVVEEVVPSLDVPLDVLDGVKPPVKNDDDKVLPSCGEVAEEVKRCVDEVVDDVCSLLDVPLVVVDGAVPHVDTVDNIIPSSEEVAEEVKPCVKDVVEGVVPSLDVPDVVDGAVTRAENVDTLIPSSEEVAEEVKPCVKDVVEGVVPSLDVPDVVDGAVTRAENVDTLIPSSEEVAEEVKPCVKEVVEELKPCVKEFVEGVCSSLEPPPLGDLGAMNSSIDEVDEVIPLSEDVAKEVTPCVEVDVETKSVVTTSDIVSSVVDDDVEEVNSEKKCDQSSAECCEKVKPDVFLDDVPTIEPESVDRRRTDEPETACGEGTVVRGDPLECGTDGKNIGAGDVCRTDATSDDKNMQLLTTPPSDQENCPTTLPSVSKPVAEDSPIGVPHPELAKADQVMISSVESIPPLPPVEPSLCSEIKDVSDSSPPSVDEDKCLRETTERDLPPSELGAEMMSEGSDRGASASASPPVDVPQVNQNFSSEVNSEAKVSEKIAISDMSVENNCVLDSQTLKTESIDVVKDVEGDDVPQLTCQIPLEKLTEVLDGCKKTTTDSDVEDKLNVSDKVEIEKQKSPGTNRISNKLKIKRSPLKYPSDEIQMADEEVKFTRTLRRNVRTIAQTQKQEVPKRRQPKRRETVKEVPIPDLVESDSTTVPADPIIEQDSVTSSAPRLSSYDKFSFQIEDVHLMKLSGDEKLYACDICDGVYQRAFSLKRHYLRSHINYSHLSERDIVNCGIVVNSNMAVSSGENTKIIVQKSKNVDERTSGNEAEEKTLLASKSVGKDLSETNAEVPSSCPLSPSSITDDTRTFCKRLVDELVEKSTPPDSDTKNISSFNESSDSLILDNSESDISIPLTRQAKHDLNESVAQELLGDTDVSTMDSESVISERFRCHLCGLCFDLKLSLKIHLTDHPLAATNETNPYRCAYCQATFSYKTAYLRHLVTHTAEPAASDHLCPYCDKQYSTAGVLKRHMSRMHHEVASRKTAGKRHRIKYCFLCPATLNKKFNKLDMLLKHLIADHSDIYHACSDCETRFPDRYHLDRHNRILHGLGQFVVDDKNADDVDNRMNESTSSASDFHASPTPPAAIGEVERSAEALDGSHQDNFQYSCAICHKLFTNYVNMCRHRRLAHGKALAKKKTDLTLKKFKKYNVKTLLRENPMKAMSLPGAMMSSSDESVVDPETMFYSTLSDNIRENLLLHLDGMLGGDAESLVKETEQSQLVPTSSNSNEIPSGNDSEKSFVEPEKAKDGSTNLALEKYNFPKKYELKRRTDRLKNAYNSSMSYLDISTQLIVKNKTEWLSSRLSESSSETSQESNGNLGSDKTYCEYLNLVRKPNPGIMTSVTRPIVTHKTELEVPTKQKPTKPLYVSSRKLSLRQRSTESEVREVLEETLSNDSEAEVIPEEDASKTVVPEISEIAEEKEPTQCSTPESSLETESDPLENAQIPSDPSSLVSIESSKSQEQSETVSEVMGAVKTLADVFKPSCLLVSMSPNNVFEFSGDWVRPRTYVCAACNAKFADIYELQDHKWSLHPNAWVSHFEFYDAHLQSTPSDTVRMSLELYKRYLKPQGVLALAPPATCDAPMRCSKCARSCALAADFHRHLLECGGDTVWMTTMFAASPGAGRRNRKWRPFGSRRRKQQGRRGMKRNIPNTPMRMTVHKNRSRTNDAETIQRMIANLPAKRSTRRAIQFKDDDIKTRSQATIHSNRLLRKRYKVTFATNFSRPPLKSQKERDRPVKSQPTSAVEVLPAVRNRKSVLIQPKLSQPAKKPQRLATSKLIQSSLNFPKRRHLQNNNKKSVEPRKEVISEVLNRVTRKSLDSLMSPPAVKKRMGRPPKRQSLPIAGQSKLTSILPKPRSSSASPASVTKSPVTKTLRARSKPAEPTSAGVESSSVNEEEPGADKLEKSETSHILAEMRKTMLENEQRLLNQQQTSVETKRKRVTLAQGQLAKKLKSIPAKSLKISSFFPKVTPKTRQQLGTVTIPRVLTLEPALTETKTSPSILDTTARLKQRLEEKRKSLSLSTLPTDIPNEVLQSVLEDNSKKVNARRKKLEAEMSKSPRTVKRPTEDPEERFLRIKGYVPPEELSNEPIMCPGCGLEFHNHAACERHRRKCTYSQPPAEEPKKTQPEVKVNPVEESPAFICPTCGAHFANRSTGTKHQKRCVVEVEKPSEENVNTSEDVSNCPGCGAVFSSLTALTRHRRKCIPRKTPPPDPVAQYEPIKCSSCSEGFSNRTAYMRHRKKCVTTPAVTPDDAEEAFICTRCGVQFGNHAACERHRRKCSYNQEPPSKAATPVANSPFLCGSCNKSFVYKGRFDVHKLTCKQVTVVSTVLVPDVVLPDPVIDSLLDIPEDVPLSMLVTKGRTLNFKLMRKPMKNAHKPMKKIHKPMKKIHKPMKKIRKPRVVRKNLRSLRRRKSERLSLTLKKAPTKEEDENMPELEKQEPLLNVPVVSPSNLSDIPILSPFSDVAGIEDENQKKATPKRRKKPETEAAKTDSPQVKGIKTMRPKQKPKQSKPLPSSISPNPVNPSQKKSPRKTVKKSYPRNLTTDTPAVVAAPPDPPVEELATELDDIIDISKLQATAREVELDSELPSLTAVQNEVDIKLPAVSPRAEEVVLAAKPLNVQETNKMSRQVAKKGTPRKLQDRKSKVMKKPRGKKKQSDVKNDASSGEPLSLQARLDNIPALLEAQREGSSTRSVPASRCADPVSLNTLEVGQAHTSVQGIPEPLKVAVSLKTTEEIQAHTSLQGVPDPINSTESCKEQNAATPKELEIAEVIFESSKPVKKVVRVIEEKPVKRKKQPHILSTVNLLETFGKEITEAQRVATSEKILKAVSIPEIIDLTVESPEAIIEPEEICPKPAEISQQTKAADFKLTSFIPEPTIVAKLPVTKETVTPQITPHSVPILLPNIFPLVDDDIRDSPLSFEVPSKTYTNSIEQEISDIISFLENPRNEPDTSSEGREVTETIPVCNTVGLNSSKSSGTKIKSPFLADRLVEPTCSAVMPQVSAKVIEPLVATSKAVEKKLVAKESPHIASSATEDVEVLKVITDKTTGLVKLPSCPDNKAPDPNPEKLTMLVTLPIKEPFGQMLKSVLERKLEPKSYALKYFPPFTLQPVKTKVIESYEKVLEPAVTKVVNKKKDDSVALLKETPPIVPALSFKQHEVSTEKVTLLPIEKVTRIPTERVIKVRSGNGKKVQKEKVTKVQTEKITKVSTEKVIKVLSGDGIKVPTGTVTKIPMERVIKVPTERVIKVPSERVTKVPMERVMKVLSVDGITIPAETVTKVPAEKVIKVLSVDGITVPAERVTKVPAERVIKVLSVDGIKVLTDKVTKVPAERVTNALPERVTKVLTGAVIEVITKEVTEVLAQNVTSVLSKQVTEVPAKHVTAVPAKQVTEVPAKHVTSDLRKQVAEVPAKHVTAVPAKQVTEVPAKHVTSVLRKQVAEVPAKHVTAVPAKQVTEVPAKHVTSVLRKQVTEVPAKHVTAVPAKQVTESLARNVTSVLHKQVTEVPAKHVTTVPAKQVTEVLAKHATSVPPKEVTEVLAKQVAEVPIKHITEVPVIKETSPQKLTSKPATVKPERKATKRKRNVGGKRSTSPVARRQSLRSPSPPLVIPRERSVRRTRCNFSYEEYTSDVASETSSEIISIRPESSEAKLSQDKPETSSKIPEKTTQVNFSQPKPEAKTSEEPRAKFESTPKLSKPKPVAKLSETKSPEVPKPLEEHTISQSSTDLKQTINIAANVIEDKTPEIEIIEVIPAKCPDPEPILQEVSITGDKNISATNVDDQEVKVAQKRKRRKNSLDTHYFCDICTKHYYSNYNLVKHKESTGHKLKEANLGAVNNPVEDFQATADENALNEITKLDLDTKSPSKKVARLTPEKVASPPQYLTENFAKDSDLKINQEFGNYESVSNWLDQQLNEQMDTDWIEPELSYNLDSPEFVPNSSNKACEGKRSLQHSEDLDAILNADSLRDLQKAMRATDDEMVMLRRFKEGDDEKADPTQRSLQGESLKRYMTTAFSGLLDRAHAMLQDPWQMSNLALNRHTLEAIRRLAACRATPDDKPSDALTTLSSKQAPRKAVGIEGNNLSTGKGMVPSPVSPAESYHSEYIESPLEMLASQATKIVNRGLAKTSQDSEKDIEITKTKSKILQCVYLKKAKTLSNEDLPTNCVQKNEIKVTSRGKEVLKKLTNPTLREPGDELMKVDKEKQCSVDKTWKDLKAGRNRDTELKKCRTDVPLNKNDRLIAEAALRDLNKGRVQKPSNHRFWGNNYWGVHQYKFTKSEKAKVVVSPAVASKEGKTSKHEHDQPETSAALDVDVYDFNDEEVISPFRESGFRTSEPTGSKRSGEKQKRPKKIVKLSKVTIAEPEVLTVPEPSSEATTEKKQLSEGKPISNKTISVKSVEKEVYRTEEEIKNDALPVELLPRRRNNVCYTEIFDDVFSDTEDFSYIDFDDKPMRKKAVPRKPAQKPPPKAPPKGKKNNILSCVFGKARRNSNITGGSEMSDGDRECIAKSKSVDSDDITEDKTVS